MAKGRGRLGIGTARRAAGGATLALALLLAGCGASDPAPAPGAADRGGGNVVGNPVANDAAPAARERSATLRRDSRVLERPARSPAPADPGNATRD